MDVSGGGDETAIVKRTGWQRDGPRRLDAWHGTATNPTELSCFARSGKRVAGEVLLTGVKQERAACEENGCAVQGSGLSTATTAVAEKHPLRRIRLNPIAHDATKALSTVVSHVPSMPETVEDVTQS